MEPNAWDRAREAIARASERDDAVVTPDTAVSPFDASSTMVIPAAVVPRPPYAPHPDATQRLAPGRGHDPRAHGAPAPRHPGSAEHAAPAPRVHDAGVGPAPGWSAPRSTHLPPEPPTRPVEVSDPRGAPARVAGERPPTAPFSALELPGGTLDDDRDESRADEGRPRRSWWRRLFRR